MSDRSSPRPPSIAVLGIGEAAGAFLGGWDRRGAGIAAFDIKSAAADTAGWVEERCARFGVEHCPEVPAALRSAGLVVSLVTADQAVAAAGEAAPHLQAGALYVDGNSCSPDSKRRAARLVEAAGGRYVDMAIMAPVQRDRHRTPVLLAGPHAAEALQVLQGLGMRAEIAGDQVGQASSIKMVRSVMIKGIEALTAECMLAARRAGVMDAVLASLQASDPQLDWRKRSSYCLERMMVHGLRRAAEMREVAETVAALGLPERMSLAIAAWQQEIGEQHLAGGEDSLEERADRIVAALAGRSRRRPA